MDAWIEIKYVVSPPEVIPRRILYGCVDWNRHSRRYFACTFRRILYGCVDWNKAHTSIRITDCVASFMDAWIEIGERGEKLLEDLVASFMDAWIEITKTDIRSIK